MRSPQMLAVRSQGTRVYRMDGSDFALLIEGGTFEDVNREIGKMRQAFSVLDIDRERVHVDFGRVQCCFRRMADTLTRS